MKIDITKSKKKKVTIIFYTLALAFTILLIDYLSHQESDEIIYKAKFLFLSIVITFDDCMSMSCIGAIGASMLGIMIYGRWRRWLFWYSVGFVVISTCIIILINSIYHAPFNLLVLHFICLGFSFLVGIMPGRFIYELIKYDSAGSGVFDDDEGFVQYFYWRLPWGFS